MTTTTTEYAVTLDEARRTVTYARPTGDPEWPVTEIVAQHNPDARAFVAFWRDAQHTPSGGTAYRRGGELARLPVARHSMKALHQFARSLVAWADAPAAGVEPSTMCRAGVTS